MIETHIEENQISFPMVLNEDVQYS